MKNITKLTVVYLFICLILPNIVFASWWNPFSWFIFRKPVKTDITTSTVPKTIIVASTTTNKYDELIGNKDILQKTIKNGVSQEDINKLIEEKKALQERIKNEIDAQVKATLKAKTDEAVMVTEQKADEQAKIDAAVKAALADQQLKIDDAVKAALANQPNIKPADFFPRFNISSIKLLGNSKHPAIEILGQSVPIDSALEISGHILDSNNEPLKGVNIRSRPTEINQITNSCLEQETYTDFSGGFILKIMNDNNSCNSGITITASNTYGTAIYKIGSN